jgi:hypothetical protein
VEEVLRLLGDAGIEVIEALRADGARNWSYVCTRAECCPPDGRPYDPVAGRVAARATVDGLVALSGREELQGTVTPLGGRAREGMRAATEVAVNGVRARLTGMPVPEEFPGVFVTEGLGRLRAAIERSAAGGRLTDREAASLGLDLAVIRVRDEAWTMMCDDTENAHIALWADLTRRLEPPFVPPAASLLAAAAWRRGDCALATIAVERALAEAPAYSMATLLAEGLSQLVSPAVLRTRMPTPRELDATMGPPRMDWLHPLLALLDSPTWRPL